jgi:chorismate mutase/prephenate dehydratase
MDLTELRGRIDAIDNQILDLFTERMELVSNIAAYKKSRGLPVHQPGREIEIIERVRDNSPNGLENASETLFLGLMDVSKAIQNRDIFDVKDAPPVKKFIPKDQSIIACQGTDGAYSAEAAVKLFPGARLRFFERFGDVITAVSDGQADCGILPLQNSTVGAISETYDLMAKHSLFINAIIRVNADHCLCAKSAEAPIKSVYSKQEALSQCSFFLDERGFETVPYANTAMAAEYVAGCGDDTVACVCSESCAKRNGLQIIASGIANASPNYTRFICFSKTFSQIADADTLSVSLAIPHTKASLYRLLTKFAVAGLNLVKIENKAIAGSEFNVIFYLDFAGSYDDPTVLSLLKDLEQNTEYFRFLGSFKEIK